MSDDLLRGASAEQMRAALVAVLDKSKPTLYSAFVERVVIRDVIAAALAGDRPPPCIPDCADDHPVGAPCVLAGDRPADHPIHSQRSRTWNSPEDGEAR